MATVRFRLSSKLDKASGKSEVLVRFFHGRIDQFAKTNVFVTPEQWNTKTERAIIPRVRVMTPEARTVIKENTEVNTRLEEINDYICNAWVSAGAGKVLLSSSWLSETLKEFNFPTRIENPLFVPLFKKYIDSQDFAKTRRFQFLVAWRAFQRYNIYEGYGDDLLLADFDVELIKGFVEFLKKEHTLCNVDVDDDGNKTVTFRNLRYKRAFELVPESRIPEERGQNTINNFLNRLRSFLIWCVNNDYLQKNPFDKYDIPASVFGTPYYITIEERNQIYEYDFSSIPRLEMQRDVFVFQCVVGCRVSDLCQLKKDSVINGAIEYIPRKTKEGRPVTVRVPLNSIAQEIVKKYKYMELDNDMLLPFISAQKYNDAIKEIFTIVGITRKVTVLNPTTRLEEKRPMNEIASSHLARRCFIGNLYKQVKDPNLIGKLSGHSEGSRAFARYRDIDEEMRKELVTMLE